MSIPVTLNDIVYDIPVTGEAGWGHEVTSYLVALSTGVLSLQGGQFPLQSELNFGTGFGLVAPYYKSSQSDIASTGVLRLSNTDTINWRNQSNNGDLPLYVIGDTLYFSGQPLGAGTQSPLLAKGDLYTFDGSNTRLPVGLNGEVLTADSSTPTGLAWAPGGGGGGGSVVGFTFIDDNGIAGVVDTPTTTPTLTLSLGDITPTSIASMGQITGLNLSGSNSGDQTITLTGDITGSGMYDFVTTYTGIVPIAKGGTGQITANAAFNALAPYQVGHAGKVLITDGANTSWAAFPGGGSVTSVAATGNNGVTTNVTNPTITPNIIIGLGNITPTSVAATGTVTGSNLTGSVSGSNTGDQTITLTGDVTGAGTAGINAILSNTPVIAGSYTNATITVDQKGRITSASNGTAGAPGTVTTVSVVSANGVSGSVANAGTTPAITLALGAITPSSVTTTGNISASGTVTGSNISGTISGTNTGNQTITLSGDATGVSSGSPNTTLPLTLSNTGVTAGTYTSANITVDSKGRITGASSSASGGLIGYTDSSNTALGSNSAPNKSGLGNTSVGRNSLAVNTANNNTAVGNGALANNSTGANNTVVGTGTASQLSTGNDNVAIGAYIMPFSYFATGNTAIGNLSLYYLGTGTYNTAVGYAALNQTNTGLENTAIGHNASQYATSSNRVSALGFNSNASSNNFHEVTCLGYNSTITGDSQVQLGGSGSTAYAYGAVQNRSDARDKTDIVSTSLGLNFITKLHPVDYVLDMRDDYRDPQKPINQAVRDGSKRRNRKHHGLIAQEVKQVLDEMGIDFGGYQDHNVNGGEDVLSIGYTELIAPMIKSIQELKAEIDGLKYQLNKLMGEK